MSIRRAHPHPKTPSPGNRPTATKEVGEAVTGIQRGVSGTLGGMNRARQIIETSIGQTDTAAQGLETILALFVAASDQVRAIATTAEQQSSATEEINRTMDGIKAIAAKTANAMREASGVVQELVSQSVGFGIASAR